MFFKFGKYRIGIFVFVSNIVMGLEFLIKKRGLVKAIFFFINIVYINNVFLVVI